MAYYMDLAIVGYTNISSVGRDRGWANYRSISAPSAWKRIADYLWADSDGDEYYISAPVVSANGV